MHIDSGVAQGCCGKTFSCFLHFLLNLAKETLQPGLLSNCSFLTLRLAPLQTSYHSDLNSKSSLQGRLLASLPKIVLVCASCPCLGKGALYTVYPVHSILHKGSIWIIKSVHTFLESGSPHIYSLEWFGTHDPPAPASQMLG